MLRNYTAAVRLKRRGNRDHLTLQVRYVPGRTTNGGTSTGAASTRKAAPLVEGRHRGSLRSVESARSTASTQNLAWRRPAATCVTAR